jgi:AraC family transcriptional regulator, transcriptional activator of pobA
MSATIPVHQLQAKNLERADFEIAPLDTDEDYDAEVPHRHNFYELLLIEAGSGIHEIDFKKYEIRPYSLHFVSPTQVHKLKSSTASGHVICFQEEVIPVSAGNTFTATFPFYDFISYSPVVEAGKPLFDELMEIVRHLDSSHGGQSVLKREIISSYLHILLLKIKNFFIDHGVFEKNNIADVSPKIQEFKRLVGRHYIDHYTVSQYAGLLNISSNYLNALCKKETGRTAIHLVHERLLLEAKRLLYSTNLSVKEISHLLHFDTDAYFVRFFKKNVGQTPLDYRNLR